MESEKEQNKTNSELNETISAWADLFEACAQIYRNCKKDIAQAKTLMLFESIESAMSNPGSTDSSTPEMLAQRILEAARELRYSVAENRIKLTISYEESIALVGKLYELTLNQLRSVRQENLIQELTLFYLISGRKEDFIKWSEKLFDYVEGDNPEFRATLFAVGLAQIFVNEADQAVKTFDRLRLNFPNASESFLGLALCYLKLNDIKNFDEMQELLIDSAPELASIVKRLALIPDFTAQDYAAEMELLERTEG